ncbi:hypothetical protein SAMN05877753_10640 [Bacillus oleivorans]|uniref:Signal transducing protein n=1 Tax=Bacillus oleivorans TaxID=1448271 RepID=A0A285CZI9_9BACI|nr:hypothetical protein [Bacillus oleivorans]SNX72363.1 hypothetical protein SAMN05877753_10640 [Bacillus oleivorans]
MFQWLYETFFARTYAVFTTLDAGELLKAKEKLQSAGIKKFKVISGSNHGLRFAALGGTPHTIKVFKKDYERAKEVLRTRKM